MKTRLLLPLLFFCAALHADHGKAPVSDSAGSPDTLEELRALVGEGFEQPAFLDVDDAFKLEIAGVAPDRLETTFAIADGYYLYRDKIKFSDAGDGDGGGVRVLEAALPPGEIKSDPYFGELAVFRHDFSAPITLRRAAQTSAPARAGISVHATYQGCAEDGICYSPVSKTLFVALPEIITSARADDDGDGGGDPSTGAPPAPTISASPGLLLGAFFAGLLLTFTPCVLPMLPILSGIIAGHGGNLTRRKGGLLALAYVLGTVITYAAIGALAGATGEQLQSYFQNLWAIGILAVVLVVMALSMFGFFTLQMPSFIQTKWHSKTRGLGGSLPVVLVLGAVSALIVGACVSPVLISFLGLAVSSGDPWIGAWMMVAMALGMGVPLLALGWAPDTCSPKPGSG